MDTETTNAPDGDVISSTTDTSSTPSTETKTEPANPDRSKEMPASPDSPATPDAPRDRSKGVEPNKTGSATPRKVG